MQLSKWAASWLQNVIRSHVDQNSLRFVSCALMQTFALHVLWLARTFNFYASLFFNNALWYTSILHACRPQVSPGNFRREVRLSLPSTVAPDGTRNNYSFMNSLQSTPIRTCESFADTLWALRAAYLQWFSLFSGPQALAAAFRWVRSCIG